MYGRTTQKQQKDNIMKKIIASFVFHLKLLCNPDLNALTNQGPQVAVSTTFKDKKDMQNVKPLHH